MSARHPVWTRHLNACRVGETIAAPFGCATKVGPAVWALTPEPGARLHLSVGELAEWLCTGRPPDDVAPGRVAVSEAARRRPDSGRPGHPGHLALRPAGCNPLI